LNNGLKPQNRVYPPGDWPAVEVLVDGQWLDGELRVWTQHRDGTWWANVSWRPTGEYSRRLGNFPADHIRKV